MPNNLIANGGVEFQSGNAPTHFTKQEHTLEQQRHDASITSLVHHNLTAIWRSQSGSQEKPHPGPDSHSDDR